MQKTARCDTALGFRRPAVPKTPSYRLRPGYTQAIVTLSDAASGKRRDYWLGQHDSPQSREAYHRLIAEWEANGRSLPDANAVSPSGGATDGPTTLDIVRAYWKWAKANHRDKRASSVRVTLRLLRQLDGSTPATEYGPRRLR